MQKYYINVEKNTEDNSFFFNSLADYLYLKRNKKNLRLVFLFTDKNIESIKKHANFFIEQCELSNILPTDITISIQTTKHNFSCKEYQLLTKLNQYFSSQNIKFGFEDQNMTWNLASVKNANEQIMAIANEINSHSYSPLEALLSAYLKVIKRDYKAENNNEHFSTSRSVYGVLNSDKIVCVGYTALFKAILEQVSSNIVMFDNLISKSNNQNMIDGYHYSLIVYIKDTKYGIDGYYYFDPTNDHTKRNACIEDAINLNYFLIPLSALKNHHCPLLHDYQSRFPHIQTSSTSEIDTIYNNDAEQYVSFSGDGISICNDNFFIKLINDKIIDKESLSSNELCRLTTQHTQKTSHSSKNLIDIKKTLHQNNVFYLTKQEWNYVLSCSSADFKCLKKRLLKKHFHSKEEAKNKLTSELTTFLISKFPNIAEKEIIRFVHKFDEMICLPTFIKRLVQRYNATGETSSILNQIKDINSLSSNTFLKIKCALSEKMLCDLINIDVACQEQNNLNKTKFVLIDALLRAQNSLKMSYNPEQSTISQNLQEKIEHYLNSTSTPLKIAKLNTAISTVLEKEYHLSHDDALSFTKKVITQNASKNLKTFGSCQTTLSQV